MRILVVSTWDPYPPDNGSRIRAYHLLRDLGQRHHVTLVCFCPPSGERAAGERPREIETHRVCEDAYRYTRTWQAVKWLSPGPLAYRVHPAMRQRVREVAGGRQWDAFVALEVPAAVYWREVRANARVVDIGTALSYWRHESFSKAASVGSRARQWVSWQKGRASEASILKDYHAASLVSPGEIDYLWRDLRGRHLDVRVVPNGVDCRHYRPHLVTRKCRLLVYNGSLTYSANYDAMRWFLAEIYPIIQARASDVTLRITGSLQGVNLNGLRLDDSVELTGYVADARAAVAEAAVCPVPLRSGGGTRLKILEAMALGVPVVATRKGVEGLEVSDGENVLLADDPAAFAARVLWIVERVGEAARLAQNARRLVEGRYDWERIAPEFRQMIEETVTRA